MGVESFRLSFYNSFFLETETVLLNFANGKHGKSELSKFIFERNSIFLTHKWVMKPQLLQAKAQLQGAV